MSERHLQEYLVNYGKSGDFLRFAVLDGQTYQRGDRVIVRTARGLEVGTVLRPATGLQQRLFHHLGVGELLRPTTADDEQTYATNLSRSKSLFEQVRQHAQSQPLEVIDVDVLMDGQTAVLQYLTWGDSIEDSFWAELSQTCSVKFILEDLAAVTEPEDTEEAGCGSPNCGKGSEGGCSDCSSGGCSSCASGQSVELQEYFSHLREKMHEQPKRIGLV